MNVIYEISEKFRAGVLEKTGYVLCSPLCIMILNFILNGLQFTVKIILGLLVSAAFFYLGVQFIWQGYKALCKVDKQVLRCYDHNV